MEPPPEPLLLEPLGLPLEPLLELLGVPLEPLLDPPELELPDAEPLAVPEVES